MTEPATVMPGRKQRIQPRMSASAAEQPRVPLSRAGEAEAAVTVGRQNVVTVDRYPRLARRLARELGGRIGELRRAGVSD